MREFSKRWSVVVPVALCLLLSGCFFRKDADVERTTDRDKTKKGAMIGAASGAVLGAVIGEGEADEILAGAVIGAGLGAGVGAYMDHQEEKLARIPGTTVERVGKNMLLIHFDSDVLFEVGSASLSAQSRQTLNEATEVFLNYPKTAIVAQGHTDSSGSESFNRALSEQRGKAVMNYVIARGLDHERIMAIGFGESQPVAGNETADGRRANRRVDILLKAKAR